MVLRSFASTSVLAFLAAFSSPLTAASSLAAWSHSGRIFVCWSSVRFAFLKRAQTYMYIC